MVWGAPCANALGPVDALIDTSAMPTETIGTSGPLLSRQETLVGAAVSPARPFFVEAGTYRGRPCSPIGPVRRDLP